jgi:hypothetical protein
MNLRKLCTLACLALGLAASQHSAAERAKDVDRSNCLTEECQRYGWAGMAGLYANNPHIADLLKAKEAGVAVRQPVRRTKDAGLTERQAKALFFPSGLGH